MRYLKIIVENTFFSLLTKVLLFLVVIVVDNIDLLLVGVYFVIDGKISLRTFK